MLVRLRGSCGSQGAAMEPETNGPADVVEPTLVVGTPFNDVYAWTAGPDIFQGGTGDDTLSGDGAMGLADPGALADPDGPVDVADYSTLAAEITLLAGGLVDKGPLGTDRLFGIERIVGNAAFTNTIGDGTARTGQTSYQVDLTAGLLTLVGVPVGPDARIDVTFEVVHFRRVIGTANADTLKGGAGNDTLVGGEAADVLVASGGNDILSGDEALAFGGAGVLPDPTGPQDVADYSELAGPITLEPRGQVTKAGGGADQLLGIEVIRGATGFANVIGSTAPTSVSVSYAIDLAAETMTVERLPIPGGAFVDAAFVVQNFVTVYGSSNADSLRGDAGENVLWGGLGADTLIGGAGDDRLLATAGKDGGDLFVGDADPAAILPGTDVDTVSYVGTGLAITLGAVGEILRSEGTSDQIAGIERIEADPTQTNTIGTATPSGGPVSFDVDLATERLTLNDLPGAGPVTFAVINFDDLNGSDNADTLVGHDGDNRIAGNAGADRLEGLAGDDTLSGGAGDDRLIGGDGNDVMTGGEGSDTFKFNDRDHNRNGGETPLDVVTDFRFGEDRLVFRFADDFFSDTAIQRPDDPTKSDIVTPLDFWKFLVHVEDQGGTFEITPDHVRVTAINTARDRELDYVFENVTEQLLDETVLLLIAAGATETPDPV